MRGKSALLLAIAVVGFVGFIYFGWLAIQAAWLGSTPNFPDDIARQATIRVGGLSIVSLLTASVSLFWFLKKRRDQHDRR